MPDFDFMTEALPKLTTPEYIGPNLKSAVKMTPRKFASSVLEVFEKLGGTSWLLTQAVADPKSFLDLLKKLIPKNVQLDNLSGFTVNLIDQFGNEVQISQTATSETSGQRSRTAKLPDDDIATGGSLPLDLSSSVGQEAPIVELKETF